MPKRKLHYKAEADRIAASRGGVCLTAEIPEAFSKTEWKCADSNHPSWRTTFISIKRGRWCKRCGYTTSASKRRWTVDRVRDFLKRHGITLLSETYVNNQRPLHVCFDACGHDAWKRRSTVERSPACPKCATNAPVKPAAYHEWAALHGGKVLRIASTVTKWSLWRCRLCGEFERTLNNMKTTQTFCPKCSKNLGERLCGHLLRQIFKVPFPELRTLGTLGIGGKPLQLDFYSADLKLAVEHQGSQHFLAKKFWGVWRYPKQRIHDKRKREWCRKNGIALIAIRQLGEVTKLEDFKDVFRKKCLKAGVVLPADYDDLRLDFNLRHVQTRVELMWSRLKDEAAKRNWTVVSPSYRGVTAKHVFRCGIGHTFSKTPTCLFQDTGCPDCDNEKVRKPIVTRDGRLFQSTCEAAKSLRSNVTSVSRAARETGFTQGVRVARITRDQYVEFSKNRDLIEVFWNTQPPPKREDHHARRPVACSDGRIFQSRAETARVLGVRDASVCRAIRANSKCAGLMLKSIERKQEAALRGHPDLIAALWV